jgi:CBS domain-containing protein
MNEKVMSVVEETTLLRAVELMVNSGKHPLPVLRNGKVVGVISRIDVVRGLLVQEEASV